MLRIELLEVEDHIMDKKVGLRCREEMASYRGQAAEGYRKTG